jgi:hypothetical protein
MDDILKTVDYKGYKINILIDSDPVNPREEFDPLTKMVCFHNRYSLGDKTQYKSSDYNNWTELKNAICKREDVAIIEPLYLYDHSGITISTQPFSCSFDSGQIGFIYITKQALRDNYSVKRVNTKTLKKAQINIENEVAIYDNYITDEVYGFIITDEEGEEVSRSYGYYGYDHEDSGLLSQAKEEINAMVEFATKHV